MKVFMTAYACEPEKGSEPAVGWGWANGLASHVDLTVATRANNRPTIEKYYADNPDYPGGTRPHFVYYDPGSFAIRLKKKGILPTQLFFALWKIGVMWKFRKDLCNYDLYHHMTYSSIRLPGLWWFSSKPVVIGPVGGTSTVSRNYIGLYGKSAWKERVRAFMIRNWKWVPWVRLSLDRADRIVGSNSEAAAILSEKYSDKTSYITEIGMDRRDVATGDLHVSPFERLELVWIGMVEPWKAWVIALRALARAKEILGGTMPLRLRILGRGSEEADAHALAEKLDLKDDVVFLRRIPLEELNDLIVTSHAMVFSSIKDTSGTVVLEAMSKGKPIICIRHQGVADMTTPETGIRVEPAALDVTVEGFAEAIVRLAKDREHLEKLGRASRDRVLNQYVWDVKARKMASIYHEIAPTRPEL